MGEEERGEQTTKLQFPPSVTVVLRSDSDNPTLSVSDIRVRISDRISDKRQNVCPIRGRKF